MNILDALLGPLGHPFQAVGVLLLLGLLAAPPAPRRD
jgi:hypothetical protein